MLTRRTVSISVSAAVLALLTAQLSAGRAHAGSTAAATPVITVSLASPTLTVGTASTVTASVPGDTTAQSGSIFIDINALGALPASDLTVTEATGGTTQTISLTNDTSADGSPSDAVGSADISLPADASQTTTFSVTANSAAVRGQLAIYVEFDSDAVDTDGNPVYEVDNDAAFEAGSDTTQIPRSTPEKVQQYVAVSRPSKVDHANYVYYASTAKGGAVTTVNAGGIAGDKVLVGDIFGSGDDYPIVYRPATSTFYQADQFATVGGVITAEHYESVRYGTKGDIPLVGAFPIAYGSKTDLGSFDTVAIYRPSTSTFYVDGAKAPVRWGQRGDIPVVGCWDGTQDKNKDAGCDSIGVFRPSNRTFYLLTLAGKEIVREFGAPGDKPVVGDWDGKGTSLIGIDRNGKFYLAPNNVNGSAGAPIGWGRATDQPLASFVNTIPDFAAIVASTAIARTAKTVGAAAARPYRGRPTGPVARH